MRCWAFGVAGGSFAIGLLAFACSSEESGGSSSGGTDASSDTNSTTNGDATTSGDGSVIGPGPSGPIDPAVAARAAVFLASCISDDGVNRTLQEFYMARTTNVFRSPSVIACLAGKANGCGAIRDCLGVSYSSDGGCGSDGSCTGSVYEECSGADFRLSVNCAAMGLECKPSPEAYCGTASETPCTGSSGTCEGTIPTGCTDRLLRRGHDCALYGATCATLAFTTDGGAKVGCKGTGATCSGSSGDDLLSSSWEGVRCENGKLVGCMAGGLSTLDCAASAVGFTCFEAPDANTDSLAYCGVAAECAPQSPWAKVAATCDATSVVMCNGGRIEKLDCLSLGFTGCNAGVCTPSFL